MPTGPKELRTQDAAKRMRDVIALHQTALSNDELIAGRYAAVRLSDGGSDGVAYETVTQAIGYQLHETQCGYFRIPPNPARWGMATCDSLLWYVRARYDAGYRPSTDRQLMMPLKLEDLLS